MKDAIHHLKHTQKKVIQSVRKAELQELQEQELMKASVASNNGNFPKSVKKEYSSF